MMAEAAWTGSWAWGIPLICLTLSLHAFGIAVLAQCLDAVGRRRLRRSSGIRGNVAFSTVLLGATGGALAVLHAVEALVWAVTYVMLGALNDMPNAILFSLDSLTTRGESNLDLAPHWRLLGSVEAMNGVLLFGISTAFLFAVIERTWRTLRPARHSRGTTRGE